MVLEMISNRGMKVWPDGFKETFTVDVNRCRFAIPEGSGKSTNHDAILALLSRITKAGIEFVKLEGLYNFDGKPGFSRGQGQYHSRACSRSAFERNSNGSAWIFKANL
jgi:isocitrate dehydrogenase